MLIAGLPGGDVAKKLAQPHERRARIWRARRARAEAWRVILYIINSGAARRISDLRYHRSGEVKTRLTIATPAWPSRAEGKAIETSGQKIFFLKIDGRFDADAVEIGRQPFVCAPTTHFVKMLQEVPIAIQSARP